MPLRRPSAPALAAALLAAFASLAFAQTYTAWRSANFTSDELSNPAISGPGADPDGDGIANLHEFVFVGAPMIADTGISPVLERIEGVLALTYRERHGLATSGVRVNLEVSETLHHWITPNAVIEATRDAFTEEGFDLVTLLDPLPPVSGATPRRFLRLRADPAPSSALKAPTAVGIKPLSPTLYEISWNDWNRDETGHRIERLASANSIWEPLASVAADVNVWQHVGADYRNGFTYRVAALRGSDVAISAAASLPDDDGDGIPNAFELGANYTGGGGTYPTSPYDFSSGGSGVSDLWAIENGFNPFTHDFSTDTDGDGLSDYEEAMRGTDPRSDDTDGDGVPDVEDGWPRHAWITVAPLPEVRYAVVPLRQKGWPATATVSQIDDQGNVLGRVPTSTNPKGLYLGLDSDQPVDVPVIPALSADNRMLVCGVSHLLAGLAPGGTVFGHVEIPLPETTPGPYSWNAYLHGVRAAMWDPATNIVTEPSLPSLPSGMRTQGFNLSGGVTLTRGGKRLEVREFIGSSLEEVAIFFDGELISYDGLDEDVGLDGRFRLLVNDDGFAAGRIVAYPSLALIDYSGNVWENGQATRLNFRPDILTSSDAERGYPTVVAGWHDSDGRLFWARRQAAQNWPEELCAPWDPVTQSPVILSSIIRTGPLGYVGQPLANDRLELIVGDKLIRNGVVRPLADLLSSGWTIAFARDINNHGVILAEAKRTLDTAGLPIPTAQQVNEPVLLVPMEVEYLTRDSSTGEIGHLGGLVDPSLPQPDVEVTSVNATITSSGMLEIHVEGTVRDHLTEFRSDGPGQLGPLTVKVNGEDAGTANLLSPASPTAPVAPWTFHDSHRRFSKTVQVPAVAGVHMLELTTSANSAGQRGQGTASILVGTLQHGDVPASGVPAMEIEALAPPAQGGAGSVILHVGSEPVPLAAEPDDPAAYSGEVQTGAAAAHYRITFSDASFGGLGSGEFFAQIDVAPAVGEPYTVEGVFAETAAGSNRFATSSAIATRRHAPSNLQVASARITTKPSGSGFSPIIPRVVLPSAFASWLEQNGLLKVELLGQEIALAENGELSGTAPPPEGMKAFYPVAGEAVRRFAIHPSLDEETFPSLVEAMGGLEMKVALRASNEHVASSSLTIARADVLPTPPAPQSAPEAGDDAYTLAEVRILYEVLFGQLGQQVLGLYEGAGVQLELTSWFGWSRYEFRGTRPSDPRTPIIRLNRNRCDTVVDAATAIFDALQDLHGTFPLWLKAELSPGLLNWSQVVDSYVAGHADETALKQAFLGSSLGPIEDSVIAMKEAVKLGMSITLVGEVVVTAIDTSEMIDDDEISYGRISPLVLSIFAPKIVEKLWATVRGTTRKVKWKLSHGIELQAGADVLEVLKGIPSGATSVQKYQSLRPLLDNGTLTPSQMADLWRGGFLRTRNASKVLAENLGAVPRGMRKPRAHHDYPVALELDFVKRGIDINSGSSTGRWLPEEFHKRIHGKGTMGWPPGGPWNYQWTRFFAEFPDATRAHVETFRDQLRALTSNTAQAADSIQWRFKP